MIRLSEVDRVKESGSATWLHFLKLHMSRGIVGEWTHFDNQTKF
jgi:hypothetical protein